MILTISQDESFSFALPMEGFSDSYSVIYEEGTSQFRTHPAIQLWKGGKVDDISIQLKIAVGIIEGLITKIDTSKKLVDTVARIYDWALPENTVAGEAANVEVVHITVGDGVNAWYRRQGFITKIQTKWMGPWDIGEFVDGSSPGYGRPMIAELNITFKPHFFGSTLMKGKADTLLVQSKHLPRRKWRFDKESMWEQ